MLTINGSRKDSGMKISNIYRIEDGVLAGTEIEPIMGFFAVKYPHRKSKDLYVPPMKIKEKEVTTFHCCQPECPSPEFEGTMDAFVQHLELHAGRLFKKLKPVTKNNPATIAVRLPKNPVSEDDNRGSNPDRRFAIKLYMEDVKYALEKQGIGILSEAR